MVVVLVVGVDPPGVLMPFLSSASVIVQLGRLLPRNGLFTLRPRLPLGDLRLSPIRRRRSNQLRQRFGPEYERAVEETDDRREAEKTYGSGSGAVPSSRSLR